MLLLATETARVWGNALIKRTGRLQRDPKQQPVHKVEEQALSQAMIKQNIREQGRIKEPRETPKSKTKNIMSKNKQLHTHY